MAAPTRNERITEIVSWIRDNNVKLLAPVYPLPVGWQWHQNHDTQAFYLIFVATDPRDNIVVDQDFLDQFETFADDMSRCGEILPIDLNNRRMIVRAADHEINFYMAKAEPANRADWNAVIRKQRPFVSMKGEVLEVAGLVREMTRALPLTGGSIEKSQSINDMVSRVQGMAAAYIRNEGSNGIRRYIMDDSGRCTTLVNMLRTVATALHIGLLEARNGNQLQKDVRPQDTGSQEE